MGKLTKTTSKKYVKLDNYLNCKQIEVLDNGRVINLHVVYIATPFFWKQCSTTNFTENSLINILYRYNAYAKVAVFTCEILYYFFFFLKNLWSIEKNVIVIVTYCIRKRIWLTKLWLCMEVTTHGMTNFTWLITG